MPKVFYTEKDIEDLVRRGILSLEMNDNVVLTDLAYEKANRLGMKLVREKPENPPTAPVRPYLSQGASQAQKAPPALPIQQVPAQAAPENKDLQERIRSAVIARLGSQVDPVLLDTIIKRVLASTGVQ
jgi:hypothetical protein